MDQYFDNYYFPFRPTSGTHAGFHRYDTQLVGIAMGSASELEYLLLIFAELGPPNRIDHNELGLALNTERFS